MNGENGSKQILWGDQHVHTTYSMDAFYISLPLMHGSRGAFPLLLHVIMLGLFLKFVFYVYRSAESYTPRTGKEKLTGKTMQCNFW
ncbi:MAG: hypothetical protein Ct9H90mP13_09840 [Pseudomonadota bacterium]|nr:MAG: hypothetical protein Ct9H90mP13_09840 [Pseudomonadota bacterium]